MKKEFGRILSLAIISLVLFSFLISIVGAATVGETKTVSGKTYVWNGQYWVSDTLKLTPSDMEVLEGPGDSDQQSYWEQFKSWYDTPTIPGTGLQKFLFMVIIFLLVFSIIGFVPVINGKTTEGKTSWVQWTLAIAVSFLSSWYLVPEQIISMIWSYQALGIVLGGLLPLLLVAVFTVQLANAEEGKYVWITKVIWIAFAVAMTMRFLPAIGEAIFSKTHGISPEKGGLFGVAFWLLTIIISLVWVFAYGYLYKIIYLSGVSEGADRVEVQSRKNQLGNIALMEGRANALEDAGETIAAEEMRKLVKKMQDNLKK